MNKYFIFRKEEVTTASVTASDTGVGMSVFAVPAESVSYMSAERGKVFIVFNDATLYQDTNLRSGESIKKSAVTIGCPVGEETQFIEDIASFITGETQRNIMRFDVLSNKSTFKLADTKDANSISSVINTRPINMQSGDVSSFTKRADEESDPTIGGIEFGSVRPIVDYNHTGLASHSDGTEIADSGNNWTNSGTGGATYNITSNAGTPTVKDPSSNDRGLAHKAVQFALGDHLIVPKLTVENDYTLFVVFSTQYSSSLTSPYLHVIYGDAAGETLGPGGLISESGPATKIGLAKNQFSFRHAGQQGVPAGETVSGQILDDIFTNEDFDPCHVFVIRRDKANNIVVHNRTGEVEVIIESLTQKESTKDTVTNATILSVSKTSTPSKVTAATAGATEGNLVIERLGTTANITTGGHFSKNVLARFGVITKDVGTSEAARLAKDLFSLYKS
jgi:hypothetical protein